MYTFNVQLCVGYHGVQNSVLVPVEFMFHGISCELSGVGAVQSPISALYISFLNCESHLPIG